MIRLSRVTSDRPIAKAYALSADGSLTKIGGGMMVSGTLEVLEFCSLTDLAPVVGSLAHNQALTLGIPLNGRTSAKVTTRAGIQKLRAAGTSDGYIARDLEHLGWPVGQGLGLFDHDGEKAPEELLALLTQAVPEFSDVALLAVPSSSHGIARASDGQLLRPRHGWHLYFVAAQAHQIGRLKALLEQRLPAHIKRSKSGARLKRYDFDLAVFSPERLDFGGATFLGAGLVKQAPAPFLLQDGGPLVLGDDDRPTQVQGADLLDTSTDEGQGEGEALKPQDTNPAAVKAVAAGRAEYMTEAEEAAEEAEAEAWLDGSEHRGNLAGVFARMYRRVAGRLKPDERAQIWDLLTFIPADVGYDVWVSVGFALRNSLHKADAEELWVRWSMTSPGHDPEPVLRRKFRSFRKAKGGTGLNIAALHRIAARYGYRSPAERGAALRELPAVAQGVSEAEGRAIVGAYFDRMPTDPKILKAEMRRALLWASTGAGKSYALAQWLKRAVQEPRRGGKLASPGVAGFKTKEQAKAYAEYLKAMGVPVFLHEGRDEMEPSKGVEWTVASCWPGQKGLVETFFKLHQSMGAQVCHHSCRIGENIDALKHGESPPHPDLPSRCWMTHHHEAIATAKAGGKVMVFTGPVPSDIRDHLTSLFHDEDPQWVDNRSATTSMIGALLDVESAALRRLKAWTPEGGRSAELEAEIAEREAWTCLLEAWAAYARNPDLPKPALGKLGEKIGDGLAGEDPIQVGGEWHVPPRWVKHLIEHYDTMRSVEGELRWSAPMYPDDLPILATTATPSAETKAECAGNIERVIISRGDQHKALVDDTRMVGMSTPETATQVATLAQTLATDPNDVFCYSQRRGLHAYWDDTLGERPRSIADEIALGASTWAAAVSHDRWAGRRINALGSFNPPPSAIARMYDERREALIARGVDPETLPKWNGKMVPGKGAFVPSEPAVEQMLIEREAAQIVQALGRATRGQAVDGTITHRVIGCRQGVAELLASEYGIHVELSDDLVPALNPDRLDTQARAMQAAWGLIKAGQAVTRAAIEAIGKIGHEAYQWLLSESPLRLRLAPLLRDKGVAARIRKGLLELAAKLGDELAAALSAWADARAYGLDHIDGDDTEVARWFPTLDRLLLTDPPPT
jgi:ribosomal protein S16